MGGMKQKKAEEFVLNENSLDKITLKVLNYAKELKLDSTSANRYAFLIDNVLDYWLQHGGEGQKLTVSWGRKLFTPCVTIELLGEKIDPTGRKTSNYGLGENDVVVLRGLIPEYEYQDGVNIINLYLKRNQSLIRDISIVSISAVVIGILGNIFLPTEIREMLLNSFLGPFIDMFFNLLRCIAGPMVFLSVVWGICGIGDYRLFGRVGKSVLLYSTCVTFLGAVVGALSFPSFGNHISSAPTSEGNLTSLIEMILGIVPSSIVDPFSTGNTLQIIFLAIAIGIALITMSNKVGKLILAVNQINTLVQYLMCAVCKLVPYIVFLLILNMIWTNSLVTLLSMWKFFVVIIVAFIVISILICLITSIRQKAGFFTIVKKNITSFIISLTTASSAAAFSSNIKNAKENYGITNEFAGFSIPLGMIVHNPIAACYNIIVVIYFASVYGISCSFSWLLIGIVVSTVVAISSPPIPGGAAVSYALLFTQMGIPNEALAVVLILDVITDFIVTSFESYLLPISLVNIAEKLEQLNKNILRKIR